MKQASLVLISLFTAAVCGLLAWFSLEFLRESIEYEDVLLGDLPAWWFQVILPLGFALIAYRYLVLVVRHTLSLFAPLPAAEDA